MHSSWDTYHRIPINFYAPLGPRHWHCTGHLNRFASSVASPCTPIATRRYISFIRVPLCIFGIGYGLLWYGLAPSFSSNETGGNFQSPSMPSKSSLNLRNNTSSKLQCDVLRGAQLFLTLLGRSALSYLASRISTMHLVALRVLTGSWAKQEAGGWYSSWARGFHQWWWSFLWCPTWHLYHARLVCQWLGCTTAACLLGGNPLYPGAGAPFYWQSTPWMRAQHHPPFWSLWCHYKCFMTLEQPCSQWVCTYWILFLSKEGPHLIQCQGGPW